MTVRNSFRKRPPFPFSNRARSNQLACDPRSYVRAYHADGRPLWAPCLAWSLGPQELGVTGDGEYGTLFGANWLAQICLDGSWVLYQRTNSEDLAVTAWDVTPPTVSASARHPTLAFDQGARPSLAWEDADGIHLREYDEVNGSYHFIGPFPGVDPVLLMDATVNRDVTDSDVVLWFLSEDRLTLRYRIQAENFATAHDHHTFNEARVLDAVDTGAYRFQLKASDETGAVIPTGSTFEAVVSDLYPVFHKDTLATVAAAEVGVYARAAWSVNPVEGVNVTAESIAGEYASTVRRYASSEELVVSLAANSGEYAIAARRYAASDDLVVTSSVQAGEYAFAAIRRSEAEAALLVTATAREGAYSLP